MDEEVVKLVIYYVLAVYDEKEQNIKKCYEVVNEWCNILINDGIGRLDNLMESFSNTHQVYTIYNELKPNNIDLLEIFKLVKWIFSETQIKI